MLFMMPNSILKRDQGFSSCNASVFLRLVHGSDGCDFRYSQNHCACVPYNKTFLSYLSPSAQILHLGLRFTHILTHSKLD